MRKVKMALFALLLTACGGQDGNIQDIEPGDEAVVEGMSVTASGCTIYMSGGYCYVNSARTRAGACDTRSDNRGVTNWYISDGGGGMVGDPNGYGGGCGEEGPDRGGRIRSFHCCVGSTCSGQLTCP